MQDSTKRPYDFALNTNVSASLQRVGQVNEPVLIIDNVLSNAHSLIDFARDEVEFAPSWTPNGGYPGIRAPAPVDYANRLVRALGPMVNKAFSIENLKPKRADCYLSMVTLPPDRLAPLQCIPHIDIADPMRIAFLHYLCDDRFGGTAFFRHRATGLETISPTQEATYLTARDREMAAQQPAKAYVSDKTACYETVGFVPARFNRVVVYRSQLLHSGRIPDGMNFSSNPSEGRLTTNVFVTYRPV